MRVDVTWDVSPSAWGAFLERCPRATFFHTPEWYRANTASRGYVTMAAHFKFSDGHEALLPMALLSSYRGLVRVAHAGIENGYGGLVSPEPLGSQHVEAAYMLVRRTFADLWVVGNPFESYPNMPPGGEVVVDATLVLPVLEPEEQRRRMADTRGKQVKRAQKGDFRVEVHTHLTAEHASRFYPLYAKRASAWDYSKWARDEAYFRALCEHAGNKLALFLAYQGDTLAGFRLLGLHGPVVMDLYLATDEAFESQYVGPLLVAEPLAWCHEQGYAAFDFQPSGRLEGVKAYKASFGAESLPHQQVLFQSFKTRSLENLRQLSRS